MLPSWSSACLHTAKKKKTKINNHYLQSKLEIKPQGSQNYLHELNVFEYLLGQRFVLTSLELILNCLHFSFEALNCSQC